MKVKIGICSLAWEIRSVGSLTEVTVQGTQNFASDVTYHLTVE